MGIKQSKIIEGILLSIFDDQGPTPIHCWPEEIEDTHQLLISMKTISLLMGDSTYQDSIHTEGINYFGIIPFPDLRLNGLTYFFLIPDKQARGFAKASTITILVDENNKTFFYENMKYLRVIIDRIATRIQEAKSREVYPQIMQDLRKELLEFSNELIDPYSSKRKIKIIFAGMDKAGKSSFLLGVKKKYSEIIKTLPTKGVNRSEEEILAQDSSKIIVWDLGGQERYLNKYFQQSNVYLYNVDLIFFFIDIQDTERITQAISLYRRMINTLLDLDEYPPIIICLNKYDPDVKDSQEVIENVNRVKKHIQNLSNNFFVKIFKTSIFTHWSLVSAYSYGLSQLSPNRELFKHQLKQFATTTNTDALLLLNENGIILSNYSKDKLSGRVFEISAPHFQTLYKTFKEFKLLKKDFIISSGITDESKKLVFKKIQVGKYNLYLLVLMDDSINIENIEAKIPILSDTLVELIDTYI